MAKSKNGGSRAYIRGRIGSDVYSVGKNGSGEKQQVVRSLAEQVANPRSESQMFGRMVMSTVMQAVSGLTPIIDHSFDGYPKGQPSISQFIKNNYANVKADAQAHAASGNYFGLNKYQEKGPKDGKWLISDGNILLPSAVSESNQIITIELPADAVTVGGLKAALGLSADGYLTFVGIDVSEALVGICRVQLTTTLADSTSITADNVASLFTISGNVSAEIEKSSNDITITIDQDYTFTSRGLIVSEKIEGAWKHNRCEMTTISNRSWNSSEALPTYPTGAQMFLNGGDL
jgi:hypothetical protein